MSTTQEISIPLHHKTKLLNYRKAIPRQPTSSSDCNRRVINAINECEIIANPNQLFGSRGRGTSYHYQNFPRMKLGVEIGTKRNNPKRAVFHLHGSRKKNLNTNEF